MYKKELAKNFENGHKINVQNQLCRYRLIFSIVENRILDHNAVIFIFYSKKLLP